MRLLTIGVLLGSFACSGVPRSADPPLSSGVAPERLYRAKCAVCHGLRSPTERTGAEWARALEKYAPRARLTMAEKDEILQWLQQVAPQRRD